MSVIDDYLKNTQPTQRAELERIRTIVHHIAPDAEEVQKVHVGQVLSKDLQPLNWRLMKIRLAPAKTSVRGIYSYKS